LGWNSRLQSLNIDETGDDFPQRIQIHGVKLVRKTGVRERERLF
jgi:hypothetical protein